MDLNSFREHAHQLVDWMADYLAETEQYPVIPSVEPGDILQQLPAHAPEQPEAFSEIFKDFESVIMPGMTHWQHPRFFGYFPANTSPPSLLAEMLSATLGAQCMSWITSPAATELEQRVMEWLQQALGLPSGWAGVIQDTASTATLCALISAREQASAFSVNRQGFTGQRYRVYASSEAHSSIEKAVRMAGLGSENLVKIAVDETFAMCPDALANAIMRDREAGFSPLAIVAAWGTTGSTALDPLEAIAAIAQREQLWLHIDAAYAGSALILPEFRLLAKGLEQADSFVFNPHKWLLTHFDCSAYFVKDAAVLEQSFGLTPEYLKTEQDRLVHNYRDWGVQLGRRFRALKLWFVLRSYGLVGLRQILRQQITAVQALAQMIADHPDWACLAPTPFNLVCFHYCPADLNSAEQDELNESLLARVNATGQLFMTHTRLNGRYTLRLVAGQWRSTEADLDFAWQILQDQARLLRPE